MKELSQRFQDNPLILIKQDHYREEQKLFMSVRNPEFAKALIYSNL